MRVLPAEDSSIHPKGRVYSDLRWERTHVNQEAARKDSLVDRKDVGFRCWRKEV